MRGARRESDELTMPHRTDTVRVPFSAAQMFDLVADIERYPEFLPWCRALRVVDVREEAGASVLTADMLVGYRMFREQFRSEARLDRPSMRIEADYIRGPMRRMQNHWRFRDLEPGWSLIEFSIDFEMRNPLLQRAAHAVFEDAFGRMADAFVARAHQVYRDVPSRPAP